MKSKITERNIFKILRMIRGIKVTDLANELDVTPSNICSIEAGRHNPSRRLLKDYAKALKVTPEFISNHMPNSENKDDRFEEYLFGVLNDVLTLDQELKSLST